MFILIGIWGGPNKIYASTKFFLYTLFGSLLALLAIIYIYYETGTFDLVDLRQQSFPNGVENILFFAFFCAFAVKIPMWPIHTWLPDAHTEAPTAGSVVLAAVLLKLGGYGFLRVSLPILPDASLFFSPLIVFLFSYSNYLHWVSCFSSKRYETINSLFFNCSHGFCYTWSFFV